MLIIHIFAAQYMNFSSKMYVINNRKGTINYTTQSSRRGNNNTRIAVLNSFAAIVVHDMCRKSYFIYNVLKACTILSFAND